ncbi:MAG: hypothetical protein KDA16_00860 [Phycisphaerales bacterium]|nr:hypothetical protein [Phycisphaerales bacterium]
MDNDTSLQATAAKIRSQIRTVVGEDLWADVGDEHAKEIIDTIFFTGLTDPSAAVNEYIDELPEDRQIDAAAFAQITLELYRASASTKARPRGRSRER